MTIRAVGAAALALVLLAACGSEVPEPAVSPAPSATSPSPPAPTPTPEPVTPGEEWDRVDPQDAGFDPAALDVLDEELAAVGSTCVAVVKDGELVHESSFAGTDERSTRAAYSITKSATAVLIGMAVADGDLALDDRASEHLPQWRGTASAHLTVRDLMANVSGRAWDYDTDYGAMVRRAVDKTAFALDLTQTSEPGAVWDYNNSAIQTLEEVYESATGRDLVDDAQEQLLDPLGMRDTSWARDGAGNPTTFSGIESSCLDLARLGLLMMRGGEWSGEQLLPAEQVREATGASSSELNAAYGLLWWVNRPGRVVEIQRAAGFSTDRDPYEGQLAPDVPADAFWALGYGNQYVAVIPSEGIVAVRLGARPATPEALTFASFTGGVLDSQR